MPEIYAKANRVIVWLGDAKDASDQALDVIRLAGERLVGENLASLSITESVQQAILKLLRRPWFRRIWVRHRTQVLFGQVLFKLTNLESRCYRRWLPLAMF
jgi:hypothetical protein